MRHHQLAGRYIVALTNFSVPMLTLVRELSKELQVYQDWPHPYHLSKDLIPEVWPQIKVPAECPGSSAPLCAIRAGPPHLASRILVCHRAV